MTDGMDAAAVAEVPTFPECVVGYRAWVLDDAGELWPLRGHRRPWIPGVNTARCECGASDRLHFEWSYVDGKRVLEPAPLHAAPEESCTCGLYSVRSLSGRWGTASRFRDGTHVAGAVASWGRMQVHATGVRAEHACVVALARPENASAQVGARLHRAAKRYRVDLVSFAELESAALEHGQPLPDTLHQAADDAHEIVPDSTGLSESPVARAPDATVSEVQATAPPVRSQRVRRSHVALFLLALLVALVTVLVVFDHRSTPCKFQVIAVGGGGTIERCVSQTTTAP